MLATRVRRVERLLGALIIAHRCRRKIRTISKHLPIVRRPGLRRAVSERFHGYACDLWHKAYAAASGVSSIEYVAEDLFYNVFENRLNPRQRKQAYCDKNHYDRLGWTCLPETIFRIINGRLFDRSYQMIDATTALALARDTGLAEFVVKPTRETGGGSRIMFLDLDALTRFVPEQSKSQADWIIQRPVVQHEAMAELHASSVNTIRMMTIRMDTEVSVISSFVRIGAGEARIDNLTPGGGLGAGIDSDGRLRHCGYNTRLQRVTRHPNHGYRLDQIVIPSFAEAQQACIALHSTIPELDLISWDVAIDHRSHPAILEFNVRRQDINLSQVCNGPVLSPYIDAVLSRRGWHMIAGVGAIDEQPEVADVA
jgi:hypothetical protein